MPVLLFGDLASKSDTLNKMNIKSESWNNRTMKLMIYVLYKKKKKYTNRKILNYISEMFCSFTKRTFSN
jgi:hypothetical protein